VKRAIGLVPVLLALVPLALLRAAASPDAGRAPVPPDAGRATDACPVDAGTRPASAAATAVLRDDRWSRLLSPAAGPPRAIGAYANGCLQGAAALPASGPGFEVLHLKRHRRYGHPALLAFVRRLAAAARKQGLPGLLIGDLAQPRGGPTLTGHRSHQTGLDVDIGYARPPELRKRRPTAAEREAIMPAPVVDLATHVMTPMWTPPVVKALELAARDPTVDRIFVNPAIKRELCARTKGGGEWLRRLRPWWGHHDHFHVRLRCPAGSPGCEPQDPLPAGDGCAGVAWWFSADERRAREQRQQATAEEARAPPPLPAACTPLLP
jgi:penicillin-insensitive murein endopeptidase